MFVAYREPILRFFAREVMDPETAWDLMAETFAEAFSSMDHFRGGTDAEGRAWLWAIARHNLYSWRERGTVERRRLAQLGIDPIPLTSAEFDHVEELADLSRIGSDIARAVGCLSRDQQHAIQLRVVEELDYAEIAVRLGVTQDVARARVSRGLRKLGRILGHHDTFVVGRQSP